MFKPVNRYILIELAPVVSSPSESLIVLPEDYKPAEASHTTATVVCSAEDVRFDVRNGSQIVVDRSMIEEINVQGTNYNVILDNYVVGLL